MTTLPLDQNTFTGGAYPIFALTGNKAIDSITGLANVLGTGALNVLGIYETVQEARLQRKINEQNAANPPKQDITAFTNSVLGGLTNPENVQKLFLSGGMIVLLIAGGIWIIKKAKKG